MAFLHLMHYPYSTALSRAMVLCLLILFGSFTVYSQNDIADNYAALPRALADTGIGSAIADTSISSYTDGEGDYDEILVTLNVQRIGSVEIPAFMRGEIAYLSIKDLFEFLKIRNSVSADLDSVQGFVINPAATYLVDRLNSRIIYRDKTFNLKPGDLIRTETNLYLRADHFGKVFGLECFFNFRGLAVTLTTKLELPAIREMQQELLRKNISRLRGEKKADTTIQRSYPFFHIGMADWAAFHMQQTNSASDTRFNLALGGIIAGGETNLSLNYDSRRPFNMRQQYYNWRFVNNDHAFLRQTTVGKIFTQATSSIFAPVTGVQFTNTPTTYRRSFGTYTLSNVTDPGWTVELYVNNVLVNYTKADASGFFTFEVPMVYGNSQVKLRFYGPLGQEEEREQYMNIPFSFIPLNQLEYTVTAGIIDDEDKGRFARANFNYGLSRRITIGGGMEYLSTIPSGKSMPFVNASMRLGGNTLLSVEHVHNVRSKALFNYRLPSNLQFDLTYIKYKDAQKAVRFNFLEEKKAVVTMPLRGSSFNAFSRLTFNQFTLPYNFVLKKKTKLTSGEFLLSALVSGVSSNLTTFAIFNEDPNPLVFSNLSLTFRLPGGIRLTPQAQYEYREKNFSSLKGEFEKNIFRNGFLNMFYEKDMVDRVYSCGVSLRYNFSFAQTAISVRQSKQYRSMAQSARGSIVYNGKEKIVQASNQNNVGKGGLVIAPFLDINCNGHRDAGEPKVLGIRLRINGGLVKRHDKDTTIRVTNLEAYTSYYLELENSFDNVAWQVKKKTLGVVINPNELKLIDIPVAVVGEVSGSVLLNESGKVKGLGRIIVNIYNHDSVLVARVLTEPDGFFSFLGLAPGTYTARIDEGQLQKLNMRSSADISFAIKQNSDGEVVDGLQFVLQSEER